VNSDSSEENLDENFFLEEDLNSDKCPSPSNGKKVGVSLNPGKIRLNSSERCNWRLSI